MALTRILIVGGGFGGVRAALDLEKKLRGHVEITLIDRNQYHLFSPSLYEVASAYGLNGDRFNMRLRQTAAIPYDEIFRGRLVQFVQAEVRDINISAKEVTTQGEHLFHYDHLVLAMGSQTADFSIPGIRDYAFQFKTLDDAVHISERMLQLFQEVAQGLRQQPLKICVVGAGFAGMELAAETALYCKKVADKLRLEEKSSLMFLFEAGPKILSSVSDKEREVIRTRLTKLGVIIMEQAPIGSVEGETLILRNGQRIRSDMTIWTAGVQPNVLLRSIRGLELTDTGKLKVGEHLSLRGHPEIFGIGDNIEFMDPATQKPVPALAYAAADQGRVVAENIKRSVKGEKLIPYRPYFDVWVAPVGGKYAVTHLWRGIVPPGFMGWIVRELIDLRYLLQILPVKSALSLYFRQRSVFLKND